MSRCADCLTDWHTTYLERASLMQPLLHFLRTHADAGTRLTEWARSIPSDFTEKEHDRAWRARTLQAVNQLNEVIHG
jgi:hypothetical protein